MGKNISIIKINNNQETRGCIELKLCSSYAFDSTILPPLFDCA